MACFSVVVPVYKVEEYLRPCLDSVLAQTFGDFELILVDDGSPDGCGAICDAYAERDSRIQVIHQKNIGLAKARHAGLIRASAEYVLFIDSDDMAEPRWLETVHNIIEKNGRPDIVLFEHRRDTGPTQYPILAEEGFYDKARLEREIYPYMLCDLRRRPFGTQLVPAFVWERACRRELLLAHYVDDDAPITLFEDMAMSYECMYYASSMYVCREPLYIYRDREQSILTGYRPRFLQECQVCFRYIRGRLGGLDPALDRQIDAAYLRKVLIGVTQLVRRAPTAAQAAKDLARALAGTGIPGEIGFSALPMDMKLYLLALKCRLYRLAVAVTKARM